MKDRYGKHVHIEELEDTPEALPRDDLQHDLQQLLRHFCQEDWTQEAKWEAAAPAQRHVIPPICSRHHPWVAEPSPMPVTAAPTCAAAVNPFLPIPNFILCWYDFSPCKLICDQR